MKRTKTEISERELPRELLTFMVGAELYDSSCSPEARVLFVDKGKGYFLKSAEKGSLRREAELDQYFYGKGLGAPVLEYLSLDKDWLLTERIAGEDGTDGMYLSDPRRLAETSGRLLRLLHDTDFADCPVMNRMDGYFATVDENYAAGRYDLSYGGFSTAEEAYRLTSEGRAFLKNDTLIHGDYCLPNFLMDNWRFTGFIDLGNGGVGDRHVDVFWGAWTLNFNLGTDEYRRVFYEAYGRELIDEELIRVISAAECFG